MNPNPQEIKKITDLIDHREEGISGVVKKKTPFLDLMMSIFMEDPQWVPMEDHQWVQNQDQKV